MKVRTLLTLTAIVSSVLGAVVVYLVLSVPNDIRADAMLKEARKQMTGAKREQARETLSKIVMQYPRTDAAAAATVALATLGQNERRDMSRAISRLRQSQEEQALKIRQLEATLQTIRQTQAKSVTVAAPPPKPAPAPAKKTLPAKKKTPPKKPAKRRR